MRDYRPRTQIRSLRGNTLMAAAITTLALSALNAGAAVPRTDLPVRPFVIGGDDVAQGRYPFMVSIQAQFLEGVQPVHFCGGTLISPTAVLTAAHCVDGIAADETAPSLLRLVANRADLTATASGQTRSVKQLDGVWKVHVHPRFKRSDGALFGPYDIAVIELNEPIPGLPLMRLPSPGSDVLERPGSLLTAVGWGNTAANDVISPDVMQAVKLPALAAFECRFAYADKVDTNIQRCAGTGGRGTCQGDSGGPVFVQTPGMKGSAVQVGVTSWAEGCAQSGRPGVYTRLSDPDIFEFVNPYTGY